MFIKPKKSLGQNFLIDRNVLEQIVDTVEITNKEVLSKTFFWSYAHLFIQKL